MNAVRRSNERGHAEHGWLDSFHSFSFADYHDPAHMGFGPLRVINEDRVQPGRGFGSHGHRDMEIISYVLEGGLAHRDSMGNGSVIRPGDVQRMSAGTGVVHSEYNASDKDSVHFLQIWIEPSVRGAAPSYEEKRFDDATKRGQWRLIASGDGRDGSVRIQQDASLFVTRLEEAGRGIQHGVKAGALVLVLFFAGGGLRHDDAGFLGQPLDGFGEAQAVRQHDELEDVAVLAGREVEPRALVVVDEEGGGLLLLEGRQALQLPPRPLERDLARHDLADGQPGLDLFEQCGRKAHGLRITVKFHTRTQQHAYETWASDSPAQRLTYAIRRPFDPRFSRAHRVT